ncbi:MAG: U32 family peptidase, partial [Candidatus Margulisiibacteriota bacterium]
IYSDTELDIIKSTLINRNLMTCFDGFRIQDIGLVSWIKTHFPGKSIHLNPEMGFQNSVAIERAFDSGITSFTFNHETPIDVIRQIHTSNNSAKRFEVYTQGPILIQYSRRRFLNNIYHRQENRFSLSAEDPELKSRLFQFLDTPFGHFMFAHFHRSLASSRDKLASLNPLSLLIDGRGQANDYIKISLELYSSLEHYSLEVLNQKINALHKISNRPQKPSFFLSNNTDYDWRDEHAYSEEPIGKIVSSSKRDGIIIELFTPVDADQDLMCINPDQTQTLFKLPPILDDSARHINPLPPFQLHYIPPHIKGLQTKGFLYFKNT